MTRGREPSLSLHLAFVYPIDFFEKVRYNSALNNITINRRSPRGVQDRYARLVAELGACPFEIIVTVDHQNKTLSVNPFDENRESASLKRDLRRSLQPMLEMLKYASHRLSTLPR